jgi:hypothetical protein
MEPCRHQIMAFVARGGASALACLCCSFCRVEPDVVFSTIRLDGGTSENESGVGEKDAGAGEMKTDAEVYVQDGGLNLNGEAALEQLSRLCSDGGISPDQLPVGNCELPLFVFLDGGTYQFPQSDLLPYDAGSPAIFRVVDGIEQCGSDPTDWYPDESRPDWLIACPRTCENIKSINWVFSSYIRAFCESVYGR